MTATLSRARRRTSTDWLWGGFGVTIASVSASFAGYMIATAPSDVVGSGSKEFSIFARWDRRPPATLVAQTAPQQTAGAAGIDPMPTGSIPSDATTSIVARSSPQQAPLSGYILREVVGNRAWIEHHNKLSLVKPGSILDEAGLVLAIERRGDLWVVKTATGVIGGS